MRVIEGVASLMSWCLFGSEMLDMTWWFDPTDFLHHFYLQIRIVYVVSRQLADEL